MRLILLTAFMIFLIVFSTSVLAAFTVSPSLSSKSLTENQQATLSVSVTNPGTSAESNIVVQLAGGWFSVVTDCSVISSLQASQTLTTNCIIKPTSTGSGLSLTATAQSAGDTTGQGSETGITVSSQSSTLTATISTPSSVSTSSTFYSGVTVTAPSSTDATGVRATISASGQCEVDTSYIPLAQNLGNITKGNSKSPTNWKLTSSSASGTCSISVSIVSDNVGNANPSGSLTVGTVGESGSSSSSSSGGGAGGAGGTAVKIKVDVSKGKAVATIPSISTNGTANFSIAAEELSVTNMEIKASKTVSNVKINVEKLEKKPVSVLNEPSGIVQQYFEITRSNITASDISKVIISFKVEKSWLTSNNVNESTVSLQRYANDMWNKLTTKNISSDATYIYYEAESPGLSTFAITGEKKAAVAPLAEEKKPEEKKPFLEAIAKKLSPTQVVIGVIVAMVIIALIVFFIKKKDLLLKKILNK